MCAAEVAIGHDAKDLRVPHDDQVVNVMHAHAFPREYGGVGWPNGADPRAHYRGPTTVETTAPAP
jgi:hypothetical protein